MSAKLDQVHTDLVRISSALLGSSSSLHEANADKVAKKARDRALKLAAKQAAKESAGKAGTRKKGKEQRTQDRLYKQQEPVRSSSGRTVRIGEPFRPPADRPARPATPIPQIQTPRLEPVPTRPSSAVPGLPPTAAKATLKAPSQPTALKPQVVTEPAGAVRKTPETFLQRVKRKVMGQRKDAGIPEQGKEKKSLPSRAMSAFRRVAGIFKRKVLGESQARTMLALSLVEERSSTTFKKCPKGALISTRGLRHSMPLNMFANPNKDNPTFPIRAGCRASKGGVARALQKDMSGAGEALTKQVLQRINAQGGTRGKDRFKAWGTGVGGKRMETYRGKPHTPQRTASLAKRLGISKKKAAALHGVSTGRPDMVKHTSPYSPVGGSKGAAGNREVARSPGAHEKPHRLHSKRKKKRVASSRAVTSARGTALAGR